MADADSSGESIFADDKTIPESAQANIARLLWSFSKGESDAAGQLMTLFYPELRRLAANRMRGERQDHTWQPTALLNELYLELRKIRDLRPVDSQQDRAAFLGFAAHLMKRLLIHHARPLSKRIEKVGVDPDSGEFGSLAQPSEDLEPLLARLAGIDPTLRNVVELKVFEGLTEPEIAERVDCSVRTVARHWKFARQWLQRELTI